MCYVFFVLMYGPAMNATSDWLGLKNESLASKRNSNVSQRILIC